MKANRSILPLILLICCYTFQFALAQFIAKPNVTLISVDSGWANNSVNTVVFRKNSLVSWKDNQFIAFYDKEGRVVLGKRKTGSTQWALQLTPYVGNTSDAHNSISIMVDGDGYLHMAWNHHNSPLQYCKSITPLSLELTSPIPMIGLMEEKITYPEFYKMKNGDLLFLYRNGESGSGNLVMNQYSTSTKVWSSLQQKIIDGEGERNAYWQATIDPHGTIHVSWVWRESYDVGSNHDLCYARSRDNGKSWEKSTGEKYVLPITSAIAEYAWKIPQNSELINQTSMSTDESGNPIIATYWREHNASIPQYQLVYKASKSWKHIELNFRKTSFSLSGGGTKRIPIARPQILTYGSGSSSTSIMLFRDEERGEKVSAAIIRNANWEIIDLTEMSFGSWEPSYDTELWKEKKVINLFMQFVEQADAEGLIKVMPHPIYVLEWPNIVK